MPPGKAAQILQLECEYILCVCKPTYTCVGEKENDYVIFCKGDIQARDTKVSELHLQIKNNESKHACMYL